MEKKYELKSEFKESVIGCQILLRSTENVKVELEGGSGRVYFSRYVSGELVGVPNLQDGFVCGDTDLALIFTCSKDICLTQTSQDLLSGDGNVIGHVYHYNGNIGSSYSEELHVVVTIWKTGDNSLNDEQFIAECFYKYLTEKEAYLFNYISDDAVGNYYNELESGYMVGFDYQSWYKGKMLAADSELKQYKLVFALLLSYDNHYCGSPDQLKYVVYKNIVIAFGKKQWNEEKQTVGSCPFQNIRGIVLNDVEMNQFVKAEDEIGGETLFENGELKVAASYLDKDSELKIKANRALNFQNVGLDVSSSITKSNAEVLKNSIAQAEAESASAIIFPELSINKDMLVEFEKMLQSTSSLKLAVAGSYYRSNPDGAFNNVSTIYIKKSGKWKILAEYSKLIPFTMGYTQKIADTYHIDTTKFPLSKYKLLTEDIVMNDNVTLMPYKDCVVGIAICRDAMDLLDSHNPLHKYCDFVDVMLVISDNSGDSNMFVGTAECLARWHNCATVYTNSIHEAGTVTTDSYLEIAFALYPYKGSNVTGSTGVSGEINYAALPSFASNELVCEKKCCDKHAVCRCCFYSMQAFMNGALNSTTDGGMVQLIYSSGIKYSALDKCKNCKVYTIKSSNH